MRQVGSLDSEEAARRFGDYLVVCGIDNQVEAGQDGQWAVWVFSEQQVKQAAAEFARFGAAPTDAEFVKASREGRALRARQAQEAKSPPVVDMRLRWGIGVHAFRPLTTGLIAVCIVVAVATQLGSNMEIVGRLEITQPQVTDVEVAWQPGLPEIMRGEVWRLFTPMFIHFGLMHLLFNMFWLWDLGGMIEGRQRTLTLVLLVPVLAAASNMAQYAVAGPLFGGMSGVVYGLFGYVWIRGRLDVNSGLFASRQAITVMLVWFVLCFTGLLGPVANTAHAAGLAAGMAWGFVSARLARRWRR